MQYLRTYRAILVMVIAIYSHSVSGQACTEPGQHPSTAFPVCGTLTFRQNTVPLCINSQQLVVPGCTPGYPDRNPFYYKFTCYVSGTLGFLIRPLAANEDYDWQLWDVTGRSPSTILSSNPPPTVIANWAGTYGNTGASATGVNFVQCGSDPNDNKPTFSQMPDLIAGHDYVLMISHFTDGQSGYDLSFGGGTAVITDPKIPALASVQPDCTGQTLTVKVNKIIRCNTLSANGSEFTISPSGITGTAATTNTCSSGFDFDDLIITLSAPLPSGTHQLVINNGTDGNTLLDICGNSIPQGHSMSFDYIIPQPIVADSIGRATCSPDSIRIYYPKKIQCSSITASGSDFSITGTTPVTVTGASGNCINGESQYIVLHLSAPIYTKGNYIVSIQPGIDGSPILDVCGQPILPQTLPFVTADTVNADFQYQLLYGCLRDTLLFTHDGAHDVNSWKWYFNNGTPVTTQSPTIVWPASSTNNALLEVSNGTCNDSTSKVITLDNEVKAAFDADNVICPEDPLKVINNSTGQIDIYRWTYDIIGTSNLEDPPPFLFPTLNREAYYTVRLTVTNLILNCSDSTRRTLTVLDHCYIDIPNAFTPNNDGLNDYFRPHNALKADNYDFRVYNRWGQMVFQSNNWQDKWDGRINGAMQGTGTFVWMLRYTHRDTKQPVFRKGTVTVIR